MLGFCLFVGGFFVCWGFLADYFLYTHIFRFAVWFFQVWENERKTSKKAGVINNPSEVEHLCGVAGCGCGTV